jgi:hypothetical protein
MVWDEVHRRAGLLAVSAFATAVMRGVASNGTALNTARRQFCDLLVDASCGDVEDIDSAITRALASGTLAAQTKGLDPADLFDARSGIGGTLRRWLGLEADVARRNDVPLPDRGPIAAEDLEILLEVLDPCDFASYFAWRDLMFASHHATGGSDAGREVFVEWSQGNPAYYGDHFARQVRDTWRRCSTGRRPAAITLGTLLMHVDRAGHHALRLEVMSRYGPAPATNVGDGPRDDFERIATAPIIPFEETKLNAPIIDNEGH